MVGVVHITRFVKSNSEKFQSYIDYIDRKEATRNYNFEEFSLYNDYMGNPEKSGSLFTEDKENLTGSEKDDLKQAFVQAQENKSIMWQDVFSFDNKWLEKQGLYDYKTHSVDEEKIMDAVKEAMNEMIKKEGFENLIWSAALHYNTDNIHVHIASVELNNPRARGKRTNSTMIQMKSKFANKLIDRSEEHKYINDIIRKTIIGDKKDLPLHKDREMKRLALEVIKKLPNDKKQWHYNYNSLYEVRPILNEMTKYYIENYKKEEFNDLLEKLDAEEKYINELYGDGESFRYKDYKQNKIDDLYTRMGNTLLKEIKEVVVSKEKLRNNSSYKGSNIILTSRDVNRLKRVFDKDFEQMKNERAYNKLQNQIDYDNSLYR